MARGVQIGRGYIAIDTDDRAARAGLKSFSSFAVPALKATAVAAGAAGLAVGVIGGFAAKVGVEFNSMKEQAGVAFETLLGSGEAAQKMLSDLQKFSAQTPFEMKGLIDNARNLLGVGVAADKVIPTLTSLGNAAGALGLNQEAFNRIMLATTQSMAKGKIQGEELLQFAENGIPIFDLLAKALGKPKEEISKLASDGKLLASETLPKLFDQMQKDYGGAMAAQSKTLAGTWSSLKDNAKILAGTGFKPLFDEAKRVVGALGEFAASDKASKFAEDFAKKLDLAIKSTKTFANDVRLLLGGEYGGALDEARRKGELFWGSIKQVAEDALRAVSGILKGLGPEASAFASNFGGVLLPVIAAVGTVIKTVADNSTELGQAIGAALGVVNSVAGPALALFKAGLEATAAVLSEVVELIASMPDGIGTMIGLLATAAIAWKTLGGSVATAKVALTAFSSGGAIAGGLKAVAGKIDDVALSAGVMAERLTKSSKVGGAFVNTGLAMSGAMTGLAGALPAIGGALLAIAPIMATYLVQQDNIAEGADKIARGLAAGGTAAGRAAQEYGQLEAELASLKRRQQELIDLEEDSPPQFVDPATGGELRKVTEAIVELEPRVSAVGTKFRELTESMSPVQRAQAEYNRAVAEFGPNSQQAAVASAVWRGALADEKVKQEAAAQATKTHIDKLLELQSVQLGILNTEIGYRQALNQQAQAQLRANEAVEQYGPASQQYRDAMLANEQAIAGLIDAAGRHAAAQHAAEGSEKANTAAMNAQNAEALRLAVTMGDRAPESLRKFIAGMDGTSLAAIGATAKINEAGDAVIALPDGRTIVIKGDNAEALRKMAEVNATEVRSKILYIDLITRADSKVAADWLTGGRAIGGSTKANTPYLVGERGPELIFPDRSQYVATAAQTRAIVDGVGGGSGAGLVVQQTINAQPGMSEQHVADLAASGIAFRARYS